MKIESIRLKNFRMFQNVTIDKLPNCCVFVGANGTGKSSLFDLFGFLRDALTYNVKQALAKRGGFSEVVSRGTEEPIEIELEFRDLESTQSKVTYGLVIDCVDKKPVVKREVLKYSPKSPHDEVKHFLDFRLGKGKVVINEQDYGKQPTQPEKYQQEQLAFPDILALKGLGQLQRFEVASELARFIENWHLSDLQISEARKIQTIGYDEHLSSSGDNLALFALSMYQHYPEKYREILHKMTQRVPGFSNVEPVATADGRIFLQFHNNAFAKPFQSWQVSDGTIQMFAYMLLLYDAHPHSLLCVEEPEKQLYPDLLMLVAEEFSWYATRGEGQVLVSTHAPEFLNGAKLNGIFWLTQKNGYTQVHTTAEEPLLTRLVEVGDLPGALWTEGFFEGVHP